MSVAHLLLQKSSRNCISFSMTNLCFQGMRVRCLTVSPMAMAQLYTWPMTNLEGQTTQVFDTIFWGATFQYIIQSKLHRSLTQYFDLNFCITNYSGEWRFGTITGVGTMHWKSGARWVILIILTINIKLWQCWSYLLNPDNADHNYQMMVVSFGPE